MVEFAPLIRGTHGLWLIYNVAAQMALVKGSSRSDSLDHMAKVIHLAAFALESSGYFEYVESASNWAHDISRKGVRGPWARQRGFSLGYCAVATILLRLPCLAVVKVLTFL